MEFIYKRVEDKENQKILRKTKGIGTEATRTKIIGRLLHPANKLNKPYLIKDNKTRYLSPTTAGFNLFNAVNKYSEIANDPIVTAEWEKKLEEIANGEKTADAFYNEQVEFLKKIINEINSKMKVKKI